MTRGGASAKRIKIAAKETDSTPTNRVTYGFTMIIVLYIYASLQDILFNKNEQA
jgi:hypothetical protein